jgi:two-component system nitrate/nitrite response regulator NarL
MTRNTPSTRIVIATPDLGSRVTLLATLQSEPGFNVVGEASDEAGLLALPRQLHPNILLLDSALAGLVNDAVNSWPAVRIILLATIIDEAHVIQVLRLAARGIVPKTAPPQMLLKSIRSVLADQYWLGTAGIAILVELLRDLLLEYKVDFSQEPHGLTAREHHIVELIAAGHSSKEIAQELSISERTVTHHLTSTLGKPRISSRSQLAAFATTHRLAPNAASAAAP